MVIIVMGPAGSGKSTVGRALADALAWPFVDGDDYHPPANVARMQAGQGLGDADRQEWLRGLHDIIARALGRREHLVLACSALKVRYRDLLRGDLRLVRFVYLEAPSAVLEARLERRVGHFAGAAILRGQLMDLEEPGDPALTVDATQAPESLVGLLRREFGL